MSHCDTRLVLISQEQTAQAEQIGELRRRLDRVVQDIRQLQQEVATLKAAWVVRFEQEGAE